MKEQNVHIELPKLISDGMVLQRDSLIRIWGKSLPGAMMNITFLDETYQTKVDEKGAWEITCKDLSAGGPHEMIIECGEDKKVIKDILIGDVWVLGGQSNMEISIRRTLDLFADEVKNADCTGIRKFAVPQNYDFHGPVEELTGGEWISVTPQSVYDFSAIGYFYAKKLYDKYKVPIGLLQTAMGGTPAESWVSEKSLMRFGRFEELLSLCKDDDYVNETKKQEEQYNNEWYSNLYKKDQGLQDEKAPWYSEALDDSNWKQMELPATFRGTELETVRGSVWFRKEIFISDYMVSGKAKLVLGTLIDGDDTYINGVQVGNTGYQYPPRRYEVPEGLLRAGKNILAVRLILTQSIGAFITDKPYFLKYNEEELPLSGTWRYCIGASTEAQKSTTFFQYKPAGVFNGMIYPLRKYSIKGALWYQGESNTGYPNGYKELMEAVIKDWRDLWDAGDLPFFFVQLANHCPWRMEPEMSGWARIREEQRRVLEMPNTGMAVIIDAGEYNDLHPQNKKTVGERLALWTMKQVYGENIVCSGPIYEHMEIEEDHIRLHFTHIGSGLMAKGGELKTFKVCGQDGIFVAAKAKIDGD
ncbi:MAG: sialate O-acetylesterase, partial [Mobilitalea sp.]